MFVVAVLVSAASGAVFGQAANFPSKPVRVIIPWPAGGTVDTGGRQLAAQMAMQSGWNLFIENRAGANSMIGADVVIKSPPDGHTLMYNSSSYAINQALYPERKLNVLTIPISITTRRAALSQSTPGAGGKFQGYCAGEPYTGRQAAGLRFARLPPDDGTVRPAHGIQLLRAASGYADGIGVLQGDIAHHHAGHGAGPSSSRASCAACRHRGERIRWCRCATLGELGVPGFPIPGSWSGWYAPAKTPMDIVMKINGEIRAALQAPKIREVLAATGNEPVGSSPEEFARLITSEIERYTEVGKAANIKAD
jgi:tripartite-type tricarboxylate transporter receptor subunit TctC